MSKVALFPEWKETEDVITGILGDALAQRCSRHLQWGKYIGKESEKGLEEGNGTAISISFPKISVEQTSSLQLILKEHLNGKEKFQLDSSRNNNYKRRQNKEKILSICV